LTWATQVHLSKHAFSDNVAVIGLEGTFDVYLGAVLAMLGDSMPEGNDALVQDMYGPTEIVIHDVVIKSTIFFEYTSNLMRWCQLNLTLPLEILISNGQGFFAIQ
jgi:hypothetical protein